MIGAYGWSTLGGTLFMSIAVGMFWRRATREGAIAAAVVSLVAGIGGRILVNEGILPVHQIIPSIILAILAIVVVSYVINPVETEGVD